MPLSNTEFRNYDSNVLRLPDDKRAEYHEQVDRLISELSKTVRSKTKITITRVVKAGSFAKYTILRKTSDDPIDVDVVFYISGKDAKHETIATLSETLHALLIEIYPNKAVEDFEIQRKAATVTFVGSGLSVDIVPVIENTEKPGYGVQYDRDGSTVETCAPCQIKFVRDRKAKDKDFRTLVRLAKRWRNRAEIKPLKSFHIELILAYSSIKAYSLERLKSGFADFFSTSLNPNSRNELLFLKTQEKFHYFPARSSLSIRFATPTTSLVASTMENAGRLSLRRCRAWETVNLASIDDDTDVWKEVFGPRFNIEAA